MERKQQSTSSFADLFGAKHSSAADSSSSGIFSSLLASSDKAPGRWSQQLPETEEKKKRKKNGSVSQAQSSETGVFDNNFQRGPGNSQIKKSPDFSSYYQEGNVQPFHYSSSIYYGGQDNYSPPQNDQNTALTFSTETEEYGDKGFASRGNWWQGSLYY